jgi:hypothetical protein
MDINTMSQPIEPYLDNRTFEELVNSSIPDDSYNFVVDNILHDRDNGWTLNYYKSEGKSSYDAEISRMNLEIIDRTTSIVTNEKLLQKINDNIKNASEKNRQIAVERAHTATKEEKAVKPVISHLEFKNDLVETWKNQRELAEDEMMIDRRRITEIKSLLPKWEWNRYLELSLESNLQRIRNQFVIDHDEEFLRKGVTWACNYAYKNRYTLSEIKAKE